MSLYLYTYCTLCSIGIGIQDDVEKTTTLKELGLDSSKLQAVSAFLLNTYNVCYSEEQIMELTVQE